MGGSQGQEFETSLTNMVKPISTKNTKISRKWWLMPVVPATWEAEAGDSLEPERQDFEINLGNKARACLYKKKISFN